LLLNALDPGRAGTSLAALPQKVPGWVRDDLVPHGARILLIVVGAAVLRFLLIRAVRRAVDRSVESDLGRRLGENRATRVLAQATGAASDRRRQRTETLGSVLRSVITGLVFGVAVLMVLGEFSINLAPLLASAGVAGVALGFGAQSLVKDYLSGMYLLLEDQYGVGDVVDLGEVVGTVEAVSLRITKVRDANGVAWYVRNGEIVRVANKSQGWSTAIIDLPVASGQNLERVRGIVQRVAEQVWADPRWTGVLLEQPTVAGVEQVLGTTVTIRMFAKTAANEQYDVQRDLRERCLTALEAQGVRAPANYLPAPAAVPGPASALGAAPPSGPISGTV
jgi:moderate conductance mechanosensitive channel